MTSPDIVASPELDLNPAPPPQQAYNLLIRTIKEGLTLMAMSLLIAGILQVLNLRVFLASEGNSKALETLANMNPLVLLVAAVVAAPIIEEAIFRGLPYLLWRRVARVQRINEHTRQRLYWLLGIGAAMVFAVVHGNGSLPVPQLLLGLWSWHVINTRGLRYSMVLHASYNFVPVMLMLAGAGRVA